MPAIELDGVTKRFGDYTAVDKVSLSVRDAEYATLLGPSGCGKTTLLRMIAGLLKPDKGDISIGGKSVVGVPPEDRNIGYLFQNYALFPHMNVGENVGYGPMVRGRAKAKTKEVTEDMLRLVQLLEWAHFMPSEMSGGMQQRVALVRSLAAGCKTLFLDEPMSSLDPKIGAALRYEIKKTSLKLGLTVIHVTHDQADAMSISDKVIVMKKGRIAQVGSPAEVYQSPQSPYVAYFIGDSNFIKTTCKGDGCLIFGGHTIVVGSGVNKEGDVVIAVRPEKIIFEERLENTLEGVVEDVNFLGSTTRYTINVGSMRLVASTAKHPEVRKGDTIFMYLPPEDIMVFSGVKDLEGELRVI